MLGNGLYSNLTFWFVHSIFEFYAIFKNYVQILLDTNSAAIITFKKKLREKIFKNFFKRIKEGQGKKLIEIQI